MSNFLSTSCTAFAGTRVLQSGSLVDVALAIKASATTETVLTFDDASGAVVDLDLRGTTADIVARLAARGDAQARSPRTRPQAEPEVPARGRGRPKLGVIAREVTLLPRHWEWLGTQPGGASQALRRLVDEARRGDGGQTEARVSRERAYRFLSALAGDLVGFEEATRALFSGNDAAFADRMSAWPQDVRNYALALARLAPQKVAP